MAHLLAFMVTTLTFEAVLLNIDLDLVQVNAELLLLLLLLLTLLLIPLLTTSKLVQAFLVSFFGVHEHLVVWLLRGGRLTLHEQSRRTRERASPITTA